MTEAGVPISDTSVPMLRKAVQALVTRQSILRRVRTETAHYTAAGTDSVILVDATSAVVTITLPPAARHRGLLLAIKKIDASANAVTIDGNGSETIDGSATATLSAQWDVEELISDGTGWVLLN